LIPILTISQQKIDGMTNDRDKVSLIYIISKTHISNQFFNPKLFDVLVQKRKFMILGSEN